MFGPALFMLQKTLKIEFSRKKSAYKISGNSLSTTGEWALGCLGKRPGKIIIISNPKVYGLYGNVVANSLTAAGFSVTRHLIGDGERFKNLKTAESVLKTLVKTGITRTDAVVALGGGVVGDLAGFAAAMHLRGVPFLQIPTTLLAMIDSSVGGKTGVNSTAGKNLIGAFYQPAGVLIDPAVLATLPNREIVAGFCEMIKHAALSGNKLLRQTEHFLSSYPLQVISEDPNFKSEISNLIFENVRFKSKIVAGDERESSVRTDAKSRKILNFGHTLAHALEKVTAYKYIKHGEAVGYGILFAAELSKSLALCDEKDVKSLNDVVHRLGPLPGLARIDLDEVFEAFKFDKKNVAGSLQMVLLKGIGKPVIVDERDIPRSAIRSVLKKFLQTWA